MYKRREFLNKILAGGALLSLQGLSTLSKAEKGTKNLSNLHQYSIETITQDEDIWKRVQEAYAVSKSMINLNNGSVSPQPKVVLDAEIKNQQIINEMPSYQLWRVYIKNRKLLRCKLAKMLGSNPEEVAIMQNTTEAINTVMLGIDFKAGDEIILAKQDYSTARIGWEMLARRKKLKLVWVNLTLPIENDDEIIAHYTSKITRKTKFIHLTHVLNWTGQLMPSNTIKSICDTAREKGIFTLVDGAHSFAQINFKIEDLGCDAFACSLHKWLSAPLGTGMLYLRKDKIGQVWSMYPSSAKDEEYISKFEHSGTFSFAKEEAIHTAIEFHNHIGTELKEARLRYLKNYWANRFKDDERVHFYTSFKDKYTGGMALFDTKNIPYRTFSGLLNNAKIHHTTSLAEGLRGIRLSPNIYTTTSDLDYVIETIDKLLR